MPVPQNCFDSVVKWTAYSWDVSLRPAIGAQAAHVVEYGPVLSGLVSTFPLPNCHLWITQWDWWDAQVTLRLNAFTRARILDEWGPRSRDVFHFTTTTWQVMWEADQTDGWGWGLKEERGRRVVWYFIEYVLTATLRGCVYVWHCFQDRLMSY